VAGLAKSLINVQNAKVAYNTVMSGSKHFEEAITYAKQTGKLLGIFFGNNLHFDSYSVSLIGFSLGT
jgi:hypothetical protein